MVFQFIKRKKKSFRYKNIKEYKVTRKRERNFYQLKVELNNAAQKFRKDFRFAGEEKN